MELVLHLQPLTCMQIASQVHGVKINRYICICSRDIFLWRRVSPYIVSQNFGGMFKISATHSEVAWFSPIL